MAVTNDRTSILGTSIYDTTRAGRRSGYASDRTWVFFRGEVVSTPQVSVQDLRIAMASALILQDPVFFGFDVFGAEFGRTLYITLCLVRPWCSFTA